VEVIVAKHAGFCMGVNKAVEQALSAAKVAKTSGIPCFTLGELIHNPLVVEALAAQGIRVIQDPREAAGGLLILRSHGVSPQVQQQAEAYAQQVIDCTCPFVKRLHQAVADFSKGGDPVILVGDAGHPEVVGTAGWCKGPVYVVATAEEVDALPESVANALVAAQTTFPPLKWTELVHRLKERFPGVVIKETICAATGLRQQEAVSLAKQVDSMVVIGGRNSANTRKLYQTCKAHCQQTYLVERAVDLPPYLRLNPHQRIGVTAGASTPEWSLKEVVDSMNDIERKDQALTPDAPEIPQAQPVAEEAAAPVVEQTAQEAAPVTEAAAETTEAAQEPQAEKPDHAEAQADKPADAQAQDEQPAASTPEADAPAAIAAEAEAPKAASFMDEVAASIARIRAGQTVTGKVVQITDDEVCVNIGYKSDGLMKRSELVDEDVELGDDIEVEIIKVNDGEGNVILSQRNIVNRKAWEELKAKYEAGEFVEAVGKEAVKGGLLASIDGIRAFIPASHLSMRYVEKIGQFVGQTMKLKIIEVDDNKKRVVASRKEVLIAENAARKEAVWAKLEEGAIVKGIVRRFATFGAFVDLGGVDGLIHITDLSWNRSAQPQDILKANQEIDVKILSLDRERERIQLGYKQLQPRPWDNVDVKYPVGSILVRKVVRIRPFGAFIELEPGVDGLVHISQVSHTRIDKVEDVLTPGQDVSVKVLSVDPEAKRISLSIREAAEESAYEYNAEIPGDPPQAADFDHHDVTLAQAIEPSGDQPVSSFAAAFMKATEAVEASAEAETETKAATEAEATDAAADEKTEA
jgi:(E)-4-hydroxy-3-methyl-but-2-enyl pyrophosphate reductase